MLLLEFGLGMSETIWIIVLIVVIWYAHMLSKDPKYELNDWWKP